MVVKNILLGYPPVLARCEDGNEYLGFMQDEAEERVTKKEQIRKDKEETSSLRYYQLLKKDCVP
jgi:hypothetical protein